MKTNLITISTRMEKENIDYVDRIAKMFNLDRSTTIRMLFQKGIQEDKKEKAVDLYLKGKFSIETAARFCDLYIGEFLELLEDKGVELNMTLKNYEEGLKNLKKIWSKKR
jgi:predicted HTH domain antitoxin